ncbi:ras-related protein Rab-1B [Aplysia californica]|uniref:Ras-related protein Rab-1B n=1 Tax=Aplysia californica TaxID=6500 RepID=A0ABM0K1B9_APLCA|nr:ras-related protein Rab-1B [Aplysia californica]
MSKVNNDSQLLEPDFLLKLVLVGNTGVGKTCLLLRYTDNMFSETFITTIGVDFKIKTLDVEGGTAKLQLWDTAGQDRFKSIVSSFYRGADGLIVVYDLTDLDSYEALPRWLSEAERYGSPNCVRMMVGNKVDMTAKRVVERQTAQAFADRLGMEYLETSAKNASNVQEAFTKLAHSILEKKRASGLLVSRDARKDGEIIGLTKEPSQTSWCWGGESCSTL